MCLTQFKEIYYAQCAPNSQEPNFCSDHDLNSFPSLIEPLNGLSSVSADPASDSLSVSLSK